jgi:hypothetical protein
VVVCTSATSGRIDSKYRRVDCGLPRAYPDSHRLVLRIRSRMRGRSHWDLVADSTSVREPGGGDPAVSPGSGPTLLQGVRRRVVLAEISEKPLDFSERLLHSLVFHSDGGGTGALELVSDQLPTL